MAWFLFIYFSVYGGMQLLVFWKVRRAFPNAGPWLTAPGAFLLLMLFAPMLVRVLDRSGWMWPAKAMALVGFTWMAISMWFLFATVGTEVWNLGARLVALARGVEPGALVPARGLLAGVGVWTVLACVWGPIEASRVRLERITVRTAKLPAGSEPIRIVQISDLHLGLLLPSKRLEDALQLVIEAEPDVLVSTGDLLDSAGPHAGPLADRLAEVRPPLGKFAVLGNHETYSGLKNSLEFHRRAGFRVLREERAGAGDRLLFAGVDDPAGTRGGNPVHLDENVALPPAGTAEFVVLLKHRPTVREGSPGRFDLQLSGHTHRGQIFPFPLVVALTHEYVSGLYELAGGAKLYVSRGSGTWGPPMRLLSPPEVTLIALVPVQR
ncbi:MAG: metallophosphoesterase [Planctomycetota bacterium]|jgi:predicted MPP superfamily phosphohydrolase